ncbi:hypothetical protein [Erwinia sp. S59]|uniref:hypothetical protein n=1 Tax=Erwinia sp. S59 TaxID=2769340 RepID=UPI00190B2045|nr:hypothetical protein [Erwinia sp. S59]MBK0092818.1 hypothetical protein [Erwinia sp. S59]
MPSAVISSIRAEHLQQGHILQIGPKRVTISAIMWDDKTKTVRLFVDGQTFRLFYDTSVDIFTPTPRVDQLA